MLIEGFAIAGYRSFGPELQKIGPCAKLNLLAGQNNAGKSNIMMFLLHQYQHILASFRNEKSFQFESLDRHIGGDDKVQSAVFLSFDSDKLTRMLRPLDESTKRIANRILRTEALTQGDSGAWFLLSQELRGPVIMNSAQLEQVKSESGCSYDEWLTLWRQLTKEDGGSFEYWVGSTWRHFISRAAPSVQTNLIPAIRRIDAGNDSENDHSGLGLIDKLARLQNPTLERQADKERFNNINKFLQKVVGNETARLDIPHSRDMILVHMDGKTLPLNHLGTGIHEVTILGATATALANQVICIEEPELHLHPLLQKKLVRYLRDKTDNQYFLTTHSAHLLDTPEAAIFHIRYQNGATTIERVDSPVGKSRICADLGYRASDLLQANCVIWVEGPSDRIYLKSWIRTLNSQLVEGVHYSIMFYGGRLLSHLSADDREVNEFISLRRLNRFISIIIDSDRSMAHQPINKTKRRVRDEFDEGPGFAWITKGREIENYIRPDLVEKAVRTVHGNVKKMMSTDQFGKSLEYKRSSKRQVEIADKVKVAHEVVKEEPDLHVLDLKQQVEKIVAFIREANDI